MSMGDYSVAVKLTLVNNVSSGLLAMGAQFGMLSKQADLFQAKINSLKFQGKVGAGMIAFGSAVAAPFIMAVNEAGKLEQQLSIIKNATQSNTEAMNEYKKSIEQAATKTMFSSIEVAKMGAILATTGNFKIDQLAKVTDEFARYATIQKLIKGTSFESSTKQGLQLAEITGHFDAGSVKKSLDMLTKLSLIMPDNIQQVLGSMKYMQGTVKNVMGVEDEQGMLFIAMLNRMGISGTRAGSMLTAAISRSIPGVMGSGLWEGKSPQALSAMGMVDAAGHANYYNKQGKFDALKWMNLMGAYVQKEFAANAPSIARENIMKNFQFAYGANGSRIAGLMSSPDAMKQYKQLQDTIKNYPDMDKLFERMDSLYAKQLPQSVKNFETVLTNLGYTLLPIATGILKTFNDNMESIVKFMQNHEDAIRRFSESFLWIGGLSILGGSLLLLKVGLSGLLLPIKLLLLDLPNLINKLMVVNLYAVGVTAGLIAFGAAMYEVGVHWDELMAVFKDTKVYYFAERAFYYLGATMWHILHPIQSLQQAFTYLFDTVSGWLKSIGSFFSHPFGSGGSSTQPTTGNVAVNNSTQVGSISKESPYVRVNPQLRVAAAPNESSKNNDKTMQPIHVNLTVDGHTLASVVANHIYNQATNMPNTTSLYDTSLSPMPTIVNAIGIT